MEAKAPPSAEAAAQDDSRVRDLYNALRTGDKGVSFEHFTRRFYFLQHRHFTLFDVKDAFISSTASSERYLSYRDFQYALFKTARAMYSHAFVDEMSDVDVVTRLLTEIYRHTETHDAPNRMDSLRRQLTKLSVLAVLEQHLPKLVQSFHLYGKDNLVAAATRRVNAMDTSSWISIDGFVDFLNAYFEYEELCSFQTIEQLAVDVITAFAQDNKEEPVMNEKAVDEKTHDADERRLFFPHFTELFCRVASCFHVKTLEREGAQLRKAVESCRLEFSIDVFMEKLSIRLFNDADNQSPLKTKSNQLQDKGDALRRIELGNPVYESGADLEGLTLQVFDGADPEQTPQVEHTMASALAEIKAILDAGGDNSAHAVRLRSARQQRAQSMLFARLPPRKTAPLLSKPTEPGSQPWVQHRTRYAGDELESSTKPWEPPQMTLIREVIAPPPLPSNLLKRLEYAITYQTTGQYHMALGALHKCRSLYKELRGGGLPEDTEVRVFFNAMVASVYDSARRDLRALTMYLDALRVAEMLPLQHLGRALVKSCLGCMLYYLGEISLARRCHEQVLDVRRDTVDVGEDHVDTATAMNNLACCLSQDPQGRAIEEAYLLLKTAKRVYSDRFGPAHPRVEVVSRNFDRVLGSQRVVVMDPAGALASGEYNHVIPGSRFQIKALVPVKKEKGGGGKKKKKKGAKGAKKKK